MNISKEWLEPEERVDSATVENTPLEEGFYNSPFFKSYLPHERFHSRDKGCDIEMVVMIGDSIHSYYKSPVVSRICHTHNVRCSKTGWEWGWYLGTSSKFKYKSCEKCGHPFNYQHESARYCSKCRIIIQNEKDAKRRAVEKP